MTTPATIRSLLAALIAFAVVAILLSGLLGGAMSTGSDGQYVAVGLAALLAPLAGTVLGAWQARAAGAPRPALGVFVPAALSLLLGLILFASNETESDTFNVVEAVLVPIGVLLGAIGYGARWFGSTAARR